VTSETDTESTDVDVNAPPTAAFTYDPNVPNVNQAVTFDASSSADPDGETVRYTWAVDGENVSGSETFAYTFTESGDHEVRLYITDDDGVSATVTRTVTVNAPPTASIQPVDATVGEETTVEANVSDDGTIARYEWYVDGDLVSTEDTLSYTFDGSGTTQVRLEVTDENGATTATTRAVTVESDGTSTDSPDDMEPTDTDETTAQDGPGFGVVVALLAVVVAALTARRRSD
jgi:PGF-CTERM protein